MRNYLILKDKAVRFNQDGEIKALRSEINVIDGTMNPFLGAFTKYRAADLKDHLFDRVLLGARGLAYERLDQLIIELLMGMH